MRTTLTNVPILLGLLALALLYLMRWTILREPLRSAIETAVFDATAVRVEVGTIHGNVFREIRVAELRTVQPNPDSAVYSFRVDELVASYRLADLLPFLSFTNLPLPRFTSPATDIRWLGAALREADEITAGLIVTNLSRTIPGSLTLDLRGEAVVNTPEDRSSAGFRISLEKAASAEERHARIELSQIASPWWPGAPGDALSLVVSLSPQRLALSTDRERTSTDVRIDGALESSDADGTATLTGAELTVSAGRFRARATAGPKSAELVASLPDDDRSSEIVNRTLARRDAAARSETDADSDAPLVVGALDLDAVLRLPASDQDDSREPPPRVGRSVVEELFSTPALLVDDTEIDATVDARGWRFASVAVERLASSADWSDGRLSLGTSNAAARVEGLDLATASDPATGFTLSLDRAEWDPSTNELMVDDLVVRGGGGRLGAEGLVVLPPAGSGVESISGDLAGQLSIARPDEFAALLARIGIVPLLPAGYSFGTSVAVDFVLSGAPTDAQTDPRVDRRLSLGLHAEEPVVSDLVFESIEADATITSDSLATQGLRAQAIEVLAIAGESDPGMDVAISAKNAAWDTTTNEVDVDDLVVQAGGARVRMDGLVTLPPEGSGLESVRGDLGGQLSIDQPDELATILAELGVVPLLPAGYSIGSSVAVDFVLSGARLAAELRARGPALPGIALESFEADAVISSSSISLPRLRVQTAGAPGTLDGSGSFTTNRLELELDARAIPLTFLVGLIDPDLSAAASGAVSLQLSAEGDPGSPAIALIAQGDSLAIEGEPVTVAVDVRQEAGEVRLASLTIDLADLADIRGTGSAPVSFGTAGMTAGDFSGAEMQIDASLPGVIPYLLPGAAELWPEAMLELNAALDGRSASIRAFASGFERADELTIVGIEPMTEFQLTASVADVLDLTSTLTADLTSGGISLASVNADLDSGISGEARLPVAELSHFAPGSDLPGGLIRATFRVPNDETGLRGEVSLEDVMVKASSQIPTISSLTGSLVYAEQIIRIDELSGEMGGSPVSLSGSWSFIDDEESPVGIRIAAHDALLVRSPDIQLRANADIELIGSLESMRLSGDLRITEGRYTRPVQLFSLGTTAASPSSDLQLFGIEADWARSTLLDVAVRADRTFVMRNNLFDGALSADLTVGGNLAVPRPVGRVFAEAGTVLLPTARLSVNELEVRFPADSAFAPELALSATTSIQGYDMSLTVDGQLPSVEVRIVSAPPLPTDEALLLLTTGSRSSDLSFAPDVSGSLTAVGTVVGRQLLNQLSRQMGEDEHAFLERIDFEVERERETGQIGDVGVEYQLDEDENWVLRFNRREEESYTLQLGWRLWIE